MSDLVVSVGRKIRLFRKSADLTQAQLSEMTEIEQSHLGKIERGEINITLETTERIAKALKISPIELFEEYNDDLRKEKRRVLDKINVFLENKGIAELDII